MLRTDRSALICDMAETYGIMDYRKVPAERLAILAAGLREESRSKMKLAGRTVTKQEALLAAILDGVNRLVWLLSGVCPHAGEKPASVLRMMLGEQDPDTAENADVFDSPEEFEKAWENITGVSHGIG